MPLLILELANLEAESKLGEFGVGGRGDDMSERK